MYLAYSAFDTQHCPNDQPGIIDEEFNQRRDGYLAACHKLQTEIAEIQRFIPGWRPALPTPPAKKTQLNLAL